MSIGRWIVALAIASIVVDVIVIALCERKVRGKP